MGYILELRAGTISKTETALKQSEGEAAETNPELAELVAQTISAGEPHTIAPDIATYVVEVIQETSWWWGSIQHSSSGGITFRTEISEELADPFGRDFIVNWVNRPLLGLHTTDHPLIGWVTNNEIRNAVNRSKNRELPEQPDQSELLRTLIPILERAIEHDLDLWGLYL